MTPDVIVSAIIGAIVGVAGAYVSLRTLKPQMGVLKSEELKNTADAFGKMTSAFSEIIEQNRELQEQNNKLQEQIDEIKNDRVTRGGEVEALKRQIESLNRDYAQQVGALQEKVGLLRAEIMYLLQVLKEHNIDYHPRPGILDTGEHKAVK